MQDNIEDKLAKINVNDFKTVGGTYQALALIQSGIKEIKELRAKLYKTKSANDKNM